MPKSLVEFDYFTVLKVNGAKQGFEPPHDYDLTVEKGQVTLTVVLPVKDEPRGGKTVSLANMRAKQARDGRNKVAQPPSANWREPATSA